MQSSNIAVHKLGGTSLASAEHFRAVSQLVANPHPVAIVVSATAGTTNRLQQLLQDALTATPYTQTLAALQAFHVTLIQDLISDVEQQATAIASINADCAALLNLLQTVSLLGDYTLPIQDKVLGFGEIWSALILAAYLNQTQPTLLIDASRVLMTYRNQGQLQVDWPQSQALLQAILQASQWQYAVITGFIASNDAGQLITLGRNGSDYSAAIFARLLQANQLVIWTDVDGIYSADPNKVRAAFPLADLSYEEALELAYFGAKVLHPQTIFPAIDSHIPIYVKNSAEPNLPGTLVSERTVPSDYLVKGLSCVSEVALINIEGSGLSGVSGTAARVFQALQQANISVILISQASSEHSICLAIQDGQAKLAETVLTEAFRFEIEQHLIKRIHVDPDCAILAAVGDGMVGRRGVASRLFTTLTKANVNIKAIAQGSSERNLSTVVSRQEINKALRAVHAGFYLSSKTISIGLIGPGQVGRALLQQIAAMAQTLSAKHRVNLCIRGIINSQTMLLDDASIDLTHWESLLAERGLAADMQAFIDHIVAEDMPHAAIIDCTASSAIAGLYPQFIKQGLHIITPNKRANSGDFAFYQALQQLAQTHNRCYFYETTVCAGLPVIKTLQDIIATGDEVFCIQGIVSGTLSYIFNQLKTGQSFSSIIRAAKIAGYTEPDPRDDLSGMDVARKFVCLARELGQPACLDELVVANLVPPELRAVSLEEFLQRLPECDDYIANLLAPIISAQQQPAYVGTIWQSGQIDIHIAGFEADHPFSRLTGTDNMLIFKTRRYHQQPLVVQGPGAGTEVTAAGIFADLLRLVAALD